MSEQRNYPVVATDAYREGWERIFGAKTDQCGPVDMSKMLPMVEDLSTTLRCGPGCPFDDETHHQ